MTAHNEGAYLQATVRSLLATLPVEAEVIVVDDLSVDGSADGVEGLDERVRRIRPSSRAGVAGGRNLGAEHAHGEVLVFCDAHVELEPGWTDVIWDLLADPSVGAASLTISALGGSGFKGCGFTWRDPEMNVQWLGWQGETPQSVPMLCGCFLAVRRDLFESCGRFDPGLELWGLEDAELSMRLWTMGYQCVVSPQAEVQHLFRPSFPYHVDWSVLTHNLLRVGIVHLSASRLASLTRAVASREAFPGALARVLDSDVWERRATVRAGRAFDDAWFLDRFGIRVFD